MRQQLYVRSDTGKGKPLILLHGMFADGSQWVKIAQLLSKDFRVIVVDLLGHGRSPRPPKATYSATEHVSALRTTLESLNAIENATIVGYSMGGAVALAYSSIYPECVEQLYLISTPFYLKPEQMIPNKYAGSILATKASIGLFHVLENLMHTNGNLERIIKFGNSSKKFHAMIGANDNELDTEIIRKNLNQLVHTFNFVGYLKKLKVPLTFYAGKKDIFVIQSQLNALRQFCPYMDIQRLDVIKIDHMLVQNLPHEIARLLHKNTTTHLNVAVDKGRGETLVLIHGVESSSEYWTPLIPALSKDRRVIAIDLLGFGNSPKPLNISYSLEEQSDWLDRTLKAKGIEQCEIMAHSLGCLVALKYASQQPKKVSKLLFFAPVFVPDRTSSKNPIIRRLDHIDRLSDGSLLQSHAIQALGYQKMSKYLPFIRTVQNAVRNQHALDLAKLASHIPVRIVYGKNDSLIDGDYLNTVSSKFKKVSVVGLRRKGHNVALFEPSVALQAMLNQDYNPRKKIRTPKLPPSFAKQLVKLAAPILLIKSLLCIITGVLLFTKFAPWVITLGLAYFVIKFGISYIQGAFSLKNERLSYIGYIILGAISIIIGYGLAQRPELSLKVSSLIIAGIVLLAGLSRLIVAKVWTRQSKLRRKLLLSGSLMTVAGACALYGGIVSLRFITFSLAVMILVRGFQYGVYATIAIFFAYMRGFNH